MDIGKSLRYDVWGLSDKLVPFSFSDRYLVLSSLVSDSVERDVWDYIDNSFNGVTDVVDI